MKSLTLVAAVVAVGAAVGTGLVGRSHADKPASPAVKPPAPPVAVTVEPVTGRAVRRTVSLVGSLYGRDEVTVSPKVEGRVVKIHRDIGDAVRPGDVLVEIDPTDARLAVEEGERGLELELAKLGLRELPSGKFDVSALPSVVKAAAQERNALARVNRSRTLAGGASSAEDRERVETEYAVARAEFREAVMSAEATLAAARLRAAALETARQKLRDCTVVAPPVGAGASEFVVTQRSVSEGEIVRILPMGDAATLLRLVVDRPLKLKATVPERHLGELAVGQTAELEVESYPGTPFTGTVARINPAVDRASRTFQIEVHVPNEDRRLRPGSFAKVAVLTRTDPQARTVPEEAVVSFAGVTKVFAVKGDAAREVQVRVGKSLDVAGPGGKHVWVEVEGDLTAGTPVVTSGLSKLADGTAVRVRE